MPPRRLRLPPKSDTPAARPVIPRVASSAVTPELAVAPSEWSDEFKRFLLRTYFDHYFMRPYHNNMDAAFTRLLTATGRGERFVVADQPPITLSRAASAHECFDALSAAFRARYPQVSIARSPNARG